MLSEIVRSHEIGVDFRCGNKKKVSGCIGCSCRPRELLLFSHLRNEPNDTHFRHHFIYLFSCSPSRSPPERNNFIFSTKARISVREEGRGRGSRSTPASIISYADCVQCQRSGGERGRVGARNGKTAKQCDGNKARERHK